VAANKAYASAPAASRSKIHIAPTPAPAPVELPTGPMTPTLGGKLVELIEERGVTYARAAEMCGMTRQQLWRLLQGDVPNPGIFTIQQVVLGLGGRMRDLWSDGPLEKGGIRESRG
jgi:hypothetical protein